MILDKVASAVVRAPRRVALCAFGIFVLAAVAGAPLITQLPAGGYDNPHSESTAAERILRDKFGVEGMPLMFSLTSPAGIGSSQVRGVAMNMIADLDSRPDVTAALSYWTVPQSYSSGLVTKDGHAGLIVATISGNGDTAPNRARDIADRWEGTRDSVTISAGGPALAQNTINRQSKIDLITMESIAIPFTFVVLVWVFGSVVSALLPLIASVLSIVGTAAVLRLIFAFTPVSVFAMNLASALCLALAIDYTLFFINRYREELSKGANYNEAACRTMRTAGRTIAFTSLTLFLTISTLTLMPGYFLKSLGYAGLVSVALSMVSGLVLAPALIILLGKRIDAWDVRTPVYRFLRRPDPRLALPEASSWFRIAMFAMRRPVVVSLAIIGLFGVFAAPMLHLKLSYPDDRSLPTSATVRQVGDMMRSDMDQQNQSELTVVLPHNAAPSAELTNYFRRLSMVAGVTTIASPDGVFADGKNVGPPAFGAARKGGAAFLTINTTVDVFSGAGREQLDALKNVPAPTATAFTGAAQRNADYVKGVVDRIPVVLLLIALSTTVLMFMMTGSLMLPLKALVLNGLSLAATIGLLTWIFQDGHIGGFGTTSTGYLNAAILPLMSCIAFGVAMDYEVFVLSRVREEWLTSDRTAAGNMRSVAIGLAYTGRIVTAAAVVMAVVFAALIASQVSFNRMLGAGLCIGVLLDAFLIRTLLVPAVMRLAGRWNWWAPAPLARWYERWGLREEHGYGTAVERTQSSSG